MAYRSMGIPFPARENRGGEKNCSSCNQKDGVPWNEMGCSGQQAIKIHTHIHPHIHTITQAQRRPTQAGERGRVHPSVVIPLSHT
mmetsp:Transcript_24907/g.61618  ORF Transcript_24907/g.61618 Transcript_24907/m.61618 type:complete len:85 (+) Transcript_24907:36-290(+)